MADGSVPDVELAKAGLAVRLCDVNVCEMEELMGASMVPSHGLFAREGEVT